MGQKEVGRTYFPGDAERIFLISHPVHVGLVVPKVKNPLIAETFALLNEGDGQRPIDFAVLYPHSDLYTKQVGVLVDSSPKSVVDDFITHTFHKRGKESGRLGLQDLEGLLGIILIVSPSDREIVRNGLVKGLSSDLSTLKGLITVIELGPRDQNDASETEELPYKHVFITDPRKVEELIDNMAGVIVA